MKACRIHDEIFRFPVRATTLVAAYVVLCFSADIHASTMTEEDLKRAADALGYDRHDPAAIELMLIELGIDETTVPKKDKHVRWRAKIFASSVATTSLSPDGSLIAAASRSDGAIKLIDSTSGTVLRELKRDGHKGGVHALSFSADGSKLVAGDKDGNVVVWDLQSDDILYELKSNGIISAVRFVDGDAGLVAIEIEGFGRASATTKVRVVDIAKKEISVSHDLHGQIISTAISQNGLFGFFGDLTGGGAKTSIMDAKSGRMVANSPTGGWSISFSNKRQMILGGQGSVYIISPLSGELLHEFKLSDDLRLAPVVSVAMSSDNKIVAFATEEQTEVWSVPENRQLVADNHGTFELIFSPDGRWLLVNEINGYISRITIPQSETES